MNVCLDDIFWITDHFVTKPGMVMKHHELCFFFLGGGILSHKVTNLVAFGVAMLMLILNAE